MAKRLLDEIERDVASDVPLATTLGKCVILGGRSGSVDLRDWATRELRGYPPDAPLPDYRVIGAAIMADAFTGNAQVTGQRISPNELPEFAREDISEEVRLHQGVGELEAIVGHARASGKTAVNLSLPMARDLGRLRDNASGNPFQHIQSIYWSVSIANLEGVLDQVRTNAHRADR